MNKLEAIKYIQSKITSDMNNFAAGALADLLHKFLLEDDTKHYSIEDLDSLLKEKQIIK